ncbi:hypothetical protein [Trichormus variabilis]|uniref:hypothetical protein n=1 Tax=Anabaena variabilis TaxID=264691 RepID=UPI00168369A2|nr:hypothetical protein [Trichormus variabilis]MBD2625551.1 hypothetical protein [Trichormus variabilis FACHB-164]
MISSLHIMNTRVVNLPGIKGAPFCSCHSSHAALWLTPPWANVPELGLLTV